VIVDKVKTTPGKTMKKDEERGRKNEYEERMNMKKD
jgi:hypothetical protein